MPTATDTLNKGRARLVEIKTALDKITRGGFASEDGGLVVSDDAGDQFAKLIGESKDIRKSMGHLTDADELNRFLDEPADTSAAGARQAGNSPQPGMQAKSLGQMVVESAEFKAREGSRMREDYQVSGDLGGYLLPGGTDIEGKDIYTAVGGTQTNYTFGQTERDPMIPRPMRTQRVRDLFPVAQTRANLIQYVRVLGFLGGVNAARPVPEREVVAGVTNFGLKPHTSLEFAPAEAPVRTIAHYEVGHRTVLDDEPALRSVIDTELLYGLRLAEDDQLLNGDGNGESVLGLLRTPGIQSYPGTVTPSPVALRDTYLDAIRRAATRVWLANYEPTGIVLHPFDWERMELTKDANGQYLAAVNVQVGAQKKLWQLPVTSSPAMNEGTALVGAFGLGAKVYDRQQGNIRISDQHADYFIRNAVVILAEERIALVVPRPESFIAVDLPSSLGANAGQ